MSTIHLTPEGYEKIRKELERLKGPKRRELSKAIGKARAFGDISENAEYDAAKDAQGHNEARIAKLEEKLARGEIIDDSKMAKDEILIGSIVKLKDMSTKEEIEYTLVSELEADILEGKISINSPIGQGLLGHKKNETVEIAVPAGKIKYKILKISR